METQWDPEKAASNLGKHGVNFADAVGVFEDEWALTIKEEHVEGEQRFERTFWSVCWSWSIRIEVGRSV
jgi:uncharacterized DUF497 family protein